VKVALQLYTVRDKMARDYLSTLRGVRDVGYKAVEFAGHPFGTVEAGELRDVLKRLGLKPVSAHVGFNLIESQPDMVFCYAKEVGLEYIVSEPDVRAIKSLEDCLKVAEKMEAMGGKAREYGLKFGMHNHAIEFEKKIGGDTVYNILVENTSPSLVFFQPDVYWVFYAGYDPCDVIRSLKGRCDLVHLKDMKDEVSKDMVELGQGVIDMRAVIDACNEAGTEWGIVENDRPTMDSIESVRVALEYLKRNFRVE